MASTLLLDDFNERSKMTEKKYKQKLRSLIGGDSYQDAVDDMVEAEGGKLTNTVSHQGKSPEKYQQDVDRMVKRGAQLRKRQAKKDNDKMLKEGDPRQTYAEGSLMVPREKYGVGTLVKGAKKAFDKALKASKSSSEEAYPGEAGDIRDIEEFEKILSTPNKDAIFFSKEKLNELKKEIAAPDAYRDMLGEFVTVRQIDDEIIEKANALGYSSEKTKSILEGNTTDLTNLRENFNSLSERNLAEAENKAARDNFAEGSLMMPEEGMPEEGMPVDTYDNIPPEEMEEAMASQLPDDEMEDDYLDYVIGESLDDSEQQYLAQALQNDPQLGNILDKVMTVASEFSGAGEVEGPGTGVSDSIPARLSDGEFVITKKATDQIGAENLQTLMDDAERAYDGGYQMKAIGGYMEKDPEEQDSPLSQTDEEIKKLMMGANKMPSLR